MFSTKHLDTAAGTIRALDSGGVEPAVLFLHGNSGRAELFAELMNGDELRNYRRIALDLPGHGGSSPSPDPERDYAIGALASMLVEVSGKLELGAHALVGHSLGGHVVSAALPRLTTTAAVMLVSAPPIDAATMGEAFLPDPTGGAMFGGELSDDAQRRFREALLPAGGVASEAARSTLQSSIAKTDVRFRPALLASLLAGRIEDERAHVSQSALPICMVMGGKDPFLRVSYARSVALRSPFAGGVHVLEQSGHAPHLDAPQEFRGLLRQFLDATLPR